MIIDGNLAKAKKYLDLISARSEQERDKLRGPCITISRETGANARKYGEQLLLQLPQFQKHSTSPWAYFDKELIDKIINDHDWPQRYSEYLFDKNSSVFGDYINELLGLHTGMYAIQRKIVKSIVRLAEQGNVIIVGRGANIITAKMSNSFHIRLTASLEKRINHLVDYHKLSPAEAIEFIETEEEARKKYIKKNFLKDIDDPQLYHLIININLFNDEEVTELITFSLRKKFPNYFN